MRFRPLASLLLIAFATACADGANDGLTAPAEPSLSRQVGGIPSRQAERPGTWLDLGDEALWQRISGSGGVAAVGLKAPGTARGVYRGEVLIGRGDWQNARAALLNRPGITLVSADDLLPILEVRVADLRALRAIRRLPMVDYVEPVSAPQELIPVASTGGCGYGAPWPQHDLVRAPGGDFYSVKFTAMGIPEAWKLSTGRGVTIASIDTGIASTQSQFFNDFTSGSSTGRTMRMLSIPGMTPFDRCGHGTRMAGVIAAPHDGTNVVGVAWGANLISVRHADGVANVSSSAARQSVRIAAQNGAQVISMAWQSMNWFWQVSDEIKFWHHRHPILFLAAAGTSGCGDLIPDNNVVFPAEMGEVVAVTGIQYPDGRIPCGIHYGKQVELLAFLDVPTTGEHPSSIVSVGGSSNATGIVAGIAALAWSRDPSLSRDALRQRLRQSGDLFPTRDSRRGFGLVDAVKAVGG
jgi:subtilisin family serine protease